MRVRFIFRPSESKATAAQGAIICRITVDKVRKKFTTPVSCLLRDWDAKSQRVKGMAQKARLSNGVLTDIEADINRLYYDMERAADYITAERLLGAYQAKEQPRVTLLNAWAEWEGQRAQLVGHTITRSTHQVYQNKGRLLRAYLTSRQMVRLLPDEFNEAACELFLSWLLAERKLTRNYANKAVDVVKEFLKWCCRHGHARRNPLAGYTLRDAPTPPPVFLGEADIARLSSYAFAAEALRRVADVFLFQCYTGLAYADLLRFDASQHVVILDGRHTIRMTRQKTSHSTGQEAIIPLLEPARALLLRYGDRLPVLSNQVYNRMLKEVAAVVGLGQHVTSHVGRKTAGALWLAAGIPMPAVSKALGHGTVAMTERYYVRVGEEMVHREFDRVYGDSLRAAS